jgi:hypothetical protein
MMTAQREHYEAVIVTSRDRISGLPPACVNGAARDKAREMAKRLLEVLLIDSDGCWVFEYDWTTGEETIRMAGTPDFFGFGVDPSSV